MTSRPSNAVRLVLTTQDGVLVAESVRLHEKNAGWLQKGDMPAADQDWRIGALPEGETTLLLYAELVSGCEDTRADCSAKKEAGVCERYNSSCIATCSGCGPVQVCSTSDPTTIMVSASNKGQSSDCVHV